MKTVFLLGESFHAIAKADILVAAAAVLIPTPPRTIYCKAGEMN